MVLGRIADGVSRSVESLGATVSEAFFEPVIRLGVTGLARSGKTVFITSLVANLLDRVRMPALRAAADGTIRAAWLHYAGGLTQAAVAKRLGVTGVKAHRLIARAVADGVVKVSIDGEIVECAMLEDRLCALYGLAFCEVAPDLGEEGMPLRALGLAGASFLRREIERGEHGTIGLGHGRTLAAAVQELPRFDANGTCWSMMVTLRGSR